MMILLLVKKKIYDNVAIMSNEGWVRAWNVLEVYH